MEIDIRPAYGSTPVDSCQTEGLKIRGLRSQSDLDAVEQANILAALAWTNRARVLAYPSLLLPMTVRTVHKKMFEQVYTWAGNQRTRETNIGCEPARIAEELYQLCENAKVWIDFEHWSPQETAVRFHYALVGIHVFPNGNGRHARLMADLLLARRYRLPPLTWGGGTLGRAGNSHDAYIAAMRQADSGDFQPIIEFATS